MLRKYPKMVAAILLLVFTQKAGLRLWMHNWLHESRIAHSQSAQGADNLTLRCDCFDDAMMPLLESPVFVVPVPTRVYATFTVDPHATILSADKIYYSLKGPPVQASRA